MMNTLKELKSSRQCDNIGNSHDFQFCELSYQPKSKKKVVMLKLSDDGKMTINKDYEASIFG